MATPVNNATNAPVHRETHQATHSERPGAEERSGVAAAAEEQGQGPATAADTLSLSEAARQLGGQSVDSARPPLDAETAAAMAKKLHDLIGANGSQALAAHGHTSGREVARLLNVTA